MTKMSIILAETIATFRNNRATWSGVATASNAQHIANNRTTVGLILFVTSQGLIYRYMMEQ